MAAAQEKSGQSRPSGREAGQLRPISFEANILPHTDGSCLVKYGNTHVLCTASIDEQVPRFLRKSGRGWVTAEYGMLPASTSQRMQREAKRGQSGRTQEIQRLIGRSLRAITDMKRLPECQIIVDCDVIQADGGTRTAAITGGYVALYQAVNKLKNLGKIEQLPFIDSVSAISCGVVQNQVVLDLDYVEDSQAEVDANFILSGSGNIIEIQSTAEEEPFSREQLNQMLDLAEAGCKELTQLQQKATASL